MIAALLIVSSGLSRALVGMGLVSRWYVYPVAALLCAYTGFGVSIWTPIFAAVAACTLGLGHTDWGNNERMSLRLGGGPLLVAVALQFFTPDPLVLLWALACLLTGEMDGLVRDRLSRHFVVFGRVVSSAQYAEVISGAVTIGGLSCL